MDQHDRRHDPSMEDVFARVGKLIDQARSSIAEINGVLGVVPANQPEGSTPDDIPAPETSTSYTRTLVADVAGVLTIRTGAWDRTGVRNEWKMVVEHEPGAPTSPKKVTLTPVTRVSGVS